MDDAKFWKIIDSARREAEGETEAVGEIVEELLSELDASEIIDFDRLLHAKLDAAYTRNLWGAAYLINGGCSDDGFEYFRCWLIAQGRKAYDAAVADPDSLAKLVDPDCDDHECEDLLHAAAMAYEHATDKQIPRTRTPVSREPAGDDWDFDDDTEMRKRFPRLMATRD